MMQQKRTITPRTGWIVPGLAALLTLFPAALRAEDVIDWGRDPDLAEQPGLRPGRRRRRNVRPNRIRLFRITPGFLSDPVGLSDADDPLSPGAASDPNRRRPPTLNGLADGDDGQRQPLLRPAAAGRPRRRRAITRSTARCSSSIRRTPAARSALQAVTPAGRENNGVDDGPTVVSPQFSLFQSLDDGTAIQGFVGKHVNCNPRWTSQLDQAVQYGMALQRPVVTSRPDHGGSVYVFVEALGRYHYDTTTAATPLSALDVLPGVQWQLAPNWWMSGGLVVPMTAADRTESNQWQITCSFQF